MVWLETNGYSRQESIQEGVLQRNVEHFLLSQCFLMYIEIGLYIYAIAIMPLDISDDQHCSDSVVYCIRSLEQRDKTKQKGCNVYWSIAHDLTYHFYEIYPFCFVQVIKFNKLVQYTNF